MQEFKRRTAVKISIRDLFSGSFVSKDHDYLEFAKIQIHRVHILANVILIDGNQAMLDDGTGSITAVCNAPLNLDVGTFVRIIGRPRQLMDKLVISAEIIKAIDQEWKGVFNIEKEKPSPIEEQKKDDSSVADRFLQEIKAADPGDGADIESIISTFPDCDGEQIVEQLLRDGDIFMISPGKIKVLE